MTGYQIPRNSLAWLLVSQVAVIAPHVVRLPLWVMVVAAVCIAWRVMIYQGRWSYPGRLVKTLLVVGGFAGVPLGYAKLFGVEPAVALLVVAFVLKLLEMHHKRDAYVVILLAYFVCITQFLFDQSIPFALYTFGCVILITAALVGLYQTRSHLNPLKTLRTSVLLISQALPLMVVLFVLFPRISPLWTVPMPTEMAKTGVSDSMSPGDFVSLAQSDELVFKATFDAEPPSFSQLYWRGLVLTEFDGRTWTQNEPLLRRSVWRYRQAEPGWVNDIEYLGATQSYDIILQPSQQNWMFSLAMPELSTDRDFVILRDFRMASIKPIRQKLRYKLTSHLDYRIDRQLNDFWTYRYTRLPEDGNPQSRQLARQMQAAATDNGDYINDVLRMFNQQGFVYTLKPPGLGANSIDDFLLRTRRGFCEHYAGAFTFMMRAAGIPARVVVGYQGGEYNPNGNFVSVRQFDAHAWTEVWLADRGWVRVDPTSAVAPDRVERGLEAAVEQEETFLADSPLSLFHFRQLLWLTELRLQIDAIGHYWDTWVVGYTPEMQMGLLSRYFDDLDKKRLGTIMLTTFFSLLGIIAIFLLARRSHSTRLPAEGEYFKFCRAMEKFGLARLTGEGPLDYAERIKMERPEMAAEVDKVTSAFIDANYIAEKTTDVSVLKKAVRALRFRALTAS